MTNQLGYATKSYWDDESKLRSRLLAVLLIGSSVICFCPVWLHAAAPPIADSTIDEVAVERGRLTLSVSHAPLAEVLQAIGEEADIGIEIHGELTERITTSFTDILLEEGIRRLLRGQSFALSYAPSASGAKRSRLTAISVLPRSRVEPPATVGKFALVGGQREKLRRIRALARQKDANAIRELSTLALRDPSPSVRSRAVSALARLRNQDALGTLTWALKDQSSSVRIQALQGIKNLRGRDAIGDLQAIVVNDPDSAVRRQAVRLLSTIRSPEIPQVLKWAVSDSDPAVSREAQQAARRWEQRFGTRNGAQGIIH